MAAIFPHDSAISGDCMTKTLKKILFLYSYITVKKKTPKKNLQQKKATIDKLDKL